MVINSEDMYRYAITVPGIRPRLVAQITSYFEGLIKTYNYMTHNVSNQQTRGKSAEKRRVCFSVDTPFDNRNEAQKLKRDFFDYLAGRRIGNMRFVVAENPRLLEELIGTLDKRLNGNETLFDSLRVSYMPPEIITALRCGQITGPVDMNSYILKSRAYQPAIHLASLASEVRRLQSIQANSGKIIEVRALYGIKEVAQSGPWIDSWGNYILVSQSRLPDTEQISTVLPLIKPSAPSEPAGFHSPLNSGGPQATLAELLGLP